MFHFDFIFIYGIEYGLKFIVLHTDIHQTDFVPLSKIGCHE